MYKKISLFWGDFSIAVFTLSACAKPKLDAKLSVNDIIYMSRRASNLKMIRPWLKPHSNVSKFLKI